MESSATRRPRPSTPAGRLTENPNTTSITTPHDPPIRNRMAQAFRSLIEREFRVHIHEVDECDYATLDKDNIIVKSIEEYILEYVNDLGNTRTFRRRLIEMFGVPDEVLFASIPFIFFSMTSPKAMDLYVELFGAYSIQKNIPKQAIVLDFSSDLVARSEKFAKWEKCDRAHGADIDAVKIVGEWMKATENLPDNTHFYIHFWALWRDYEYLRYLAVKHGCSKRPCFFHFEYSSVIPNHTWHEAQTMAAIMDKNVLQQVTRGEREVLVDHGCRGFNQETRWF